MVAQAFRQLLLWRKSACIQSSWIDCTHHGKSRHDDLQGPAYLRQVGLAPDPKLKLETILASRRIARFTTHANMAFSVAGEGKRNLPLHCGKAGGTIKCPSSGLRLPPGMLGIPPTSSQQGTCPESRR